MLRICPGKELADNNLYLAVAMSIAVFNITKSKDACGNDIEPLHEYVGGVIRYALSLLGCCDSRVTHSPKPS